MPDPTTEAELGRLRNRIAALEANGAELLARGDALSAARCPSCDHLAAHHQPEGCWYAITTGEPGRDLVCPCIVPLAALDAPQRPGDTRPVEHIGGRANAEDCPACAGTDLPYPWICPGEPARPEDTREETGRG